MHSSSCLRWLHGAPAELASAAEYERVTFCVNVWVHHRPRGVCVRFARRHGLGSASRSRAEADGRADGVAAARDGSASASHSASAEADGRGAMQPHIQASPVCKALRRHLIEMLQAASPHFTHAEHG